MWLTLGLSVTLLVNVPVLGNIGMPRLRAKLRPTAADSLPPVWRHASRLALENQWVTAGLRPSLPGGAIRPTSDPRQLRVSIDPDSGTLSVSPEMNDVRLGMAARVPLGEYAGHLTRRSFQRQWAQRSRDQINSLGSYSASTTDQRQGLTIGLPQLPRRVQGFLGPGGPAINVYGSENIRISGTSNWSNQQIGPLGQKRSLFPTLDMQQDLDIRLEGQLSDRIRVNLLQNSANQIPLSNRIAINYRGDEDALFQQVDLGNTNLSLPGTQYVSYSGKNEGLFGVKATSKLGPLDFTILASKQEGRSERASYAGGASRQTQTIRDLEYVQGVYFFLGDPNQGGFDIPDASIRVYRDDNISTNDVNVVRGIALPDPLLLATALSADSASLGTGPVAARGNFDLLNPGADRDYEILSDIYGTGFKVLRLNSRLTEYQRLAVTYERRVLGPGGSPVGDPVAIGGFATVDVDGDSSRVMKLLRVPRNLIGSSGTGEDAEFDTRKALYPTRELELRNFYQLSGRRIDRSSLKIAIRKGQEVPPVTTYVTSGQSLSYIELLGLDNFDETSGTLVRGHDDRVDGSPVNSEARIFVDYENGTLFFLEPRPFAPRLCAWDPATGCAGPGGAPFDRAVSAVLTRRDSLVGAAGSANEPNAKIYDKYNLQLDTDAIYYIDVEFNAASAAGEIFLGRGNLLEGSDVVTINGQSLQRGRDYEIDYDLGRVKLKRQLGAADQLNIDYSYAPLFQQAGRTLIGNAFRWEGRDRSVGGAFLYESRGAQDLRPRLGEEPSRSLIGDLNTELKFRPDFLTRAVDRLPGVRTTTQSEFNIQAEVGASFPNPNTRNEVYIDDMEGVRDAVSLTMDQSRWRWSSVPSRADVLANGAAVISRPLTRVEDDGGRLRKAEVHWYSPYSAVKERELKPTLTDPQGAQNNRTVLAMSIPRRPLTSDSNPATLDSLWAGLTYVVDPIGIDLSKAQFIELWVNDYNDFHAPAAQVPRVRGRRARLHIDLGTVSEDQMRAPDLRPDNAINTEDRFPPDNQLDATPGNNEDTGLDGRLNEAERPGLGPLDLVTASASDPEGDDYGAPDEAFPEEIDARRYERINGTQGNKNLYPYPDTEDLNQNGSPDKDEDYYQFTIDLGDDAHPYLVTDLQALRRAGAPGYTAVPDDNGWRRYRIPITDSLRVRFGTPDLTITRHVRVWVEGLTLPDTVVSVNGKSVRRPLLMLGGLDIVGNRWRSALLDTAEVRAGATLTLNSVNTIDNADIYVAPFDPGSTRSGGQELQRREQSISLEFTRLRAGREIEAFKTFSLDENYSRYGKLSWYVTGFDVLDSLRNRTTDRLYYFLRFASDELGRNYYEYRAPVPLAAGGGLAWQEVRIDLTELANIKLLSPTPRDTAVSRHAGSADTLVVRGRPSFTRLRRVSFGLVNRRQEGWYESGQLWFNELRAVDVAKDRGIAQRVGVSGRMANLFSYNLAWNGSDADFLSVGQTRGSGNASSNFSFSTNFDLHRFFEATGIVLPVSFNFNQNRVRPRFSAGDDIVRGGRDLERSETFNDARGWSVAYSRNWSDRAHPLLRYTIGGVTANFSTQNSHGRNPASADRTMSYSGGINYAIAPRSLLGLRVPGLKGKFFPLPERLYTNYRVDERNSEIADRIAGTDDFVPRSAVGGRSATIQFGADTRPFEFIRHHYEASRNLNLPYRVGSVNIGQVVNWNQNVDATYALRLGSWLRPQFGWNSRYTQNNGPELSRDLSVRSIGNGQQGTVRWEFPFGELVRSGAAPGVPRPAPDTTAARPAQPPLWRRVLARLGNVSTDASVRKSSSYSRLVGMPDFLYLFGLSDDPGVAGAADPADIGRMRAVAGNQSSKGYDWRTAGRSTVRLPWGVNVTTSAELTSQTTTGNGAERGQDVLRFPDMQFEYGQFPAVIRMDRILRNPRLRTSLNRARTTEYANGRGRKSGESRSLQLQPLLGLSGELKNGMRVEMSVEHRSTERQVLQLGQSTQTDNNTDLNLSLSRSYSQGQRISFLGRESTVRSSVSLSLNGVYSRQSGQIEQVENNVKRLRNPVKRDRLSVNTNGTYGFSSNVSGNATLGFSQDRDLIRDIIHRSVRIELSARFSF
jgi:hypothetical protein